MGFLRSIFFFGLVNILVMVSVSALLALVNLFVFGNAYPPTTLLPLLVMSVVWGSVGAFISLLMSKWMAKRAMGLKIIDPKTATGEEREVLETVYRMARSAHLPAMPEVGIYRSPEVNAFATGPSKSNSLVAVSSGLLQSMNRDQVEGVIGHEVAHIANGDMVTLTLIQGIINSFVIFFSRIAASVVAGAASGNREDRRGGGLEFILIIVFQIVFGLLGNIAVAFFTRAREYRADRGGALYAGREKMISALQALQANTRLPPLEPAVKDQYANFKIYGQRPGGFMALFRTHPPLELRIERLRTTNLSQ